MAAPLETTRLMPEQQRPKAGKPPGAGSTKPGCPCSFVWLAGVVNGMQGSLASLFQSTSYVAGLASPDPANFEWLMLGSWAVVFCAAFVFYLWVLNRSRKQVGGHEMTG